MWHGDFKVRVALTDRVRGKSCGYLLKVFCKKYAAARPDGPPLSSDAAQLECGGRACSPQESIGGRLPKDGSPGLFAVVVPAMAPASGRARAREPEPAIAPPPSPTPPPAAAAATRLPTSVAGLRWLFINVATSTARRARAEAQARRHGLVPEAWTAATPADVAAILAAEGMAGAATMGGSDEWHAGGANAICLSWLLALRRAAAYRDAAALFVAEDDAKLHRDFGKRVEALLRGLEGGAEAEAVWLHARGHLRVKDTCRDVECVPPPDAPRLAGGARAWGEGRSFGAWPVYGSNASGEWTGHPVMACDPAVVLATPKARGRAASRTLGSDAPGETGRTPRSRAHRTRLPQFLWDRPV